MADLAWQCPKCKKETPVNMNHPRGFKLGETMKMRCWPCNANPKHKIVEASK